MLLAAEVNIRSHWLWQLQWYCDFVSDGFQQKIACFFVMYTGWIVYMSSCDNVGVAEQWVSWIQNNADSVLPKELLRDQTKEQSFQCGFHPRILIVTNQAQQTSPFMIYTWK